MSIKMITMESRLLGALSFQGATIWRLFYFLGCERFFDYQNCGDMA